ncbi:restriction system modified-DNA reader domain-containing protein [Cellulomonas hominis]
MPIFELDDGRGDLVQPMQPTAAAFDVDSSALVTGHLAGLLGEQVFPVRPRQGDSDAPHLLALDAAGRPVVVDVVQLLDAHALVRALRQAGGASRLSRSDLARLYPAGPEAFEADYAVFRDRSPLVRVNSGQADGPRLVLVCAEVDEAVLDAVTYLKQSISQVDVLRLGVTHGPEGRRYVDVSPLGTQTAPRRPMEPAAVSAGTRVPQPTANHVPQPSTPGPVPAATAASVPTPAVHPHRVSHAAPTVLTPTVPAAEGFPGVAFAADAAGTHGAGGAEVADGAQAGQVAGPAHPVLAAFAAGRPATGLVWVRARRGQRFEATLRTDGLIELPDGRVLADPDEAATEVAQLEGGADGWRAWRIGDDGPSLADLLTSAGR